MSSQTLTVEASKNPKYLGARSSDGLIYQLGLRAGSGVEPGDEIVVSLKKKTS